MTNNKEFVYSFDIAAWLDDQIQDGCIEIPPDKEKSLAYYIHQNFDFTDIWEQCDALARVYLGKGEVCRYCGGNCPDDEDHACDGYLGDIDNLYNTYTHT